MDGGDPKYPQWTVGANGKMARVFVSFSPFGGGTPGKVNVAADALSRWAYPASQAAREVC